MIQWHPAVSPLERKPKAAVKIQAAPPVILSGCFLLLILSGAILLKLPFATTAPISWLQSLFTATSAVTVTGLVVVDTGSTFTLFGQIIIALLIQLGGLGIMTFAVVTLIALGGKIGFLQQHIAKEAFNQTDTSMLVTTAKSVLIFAFTAETIGMLILALHWQPELGWTTALFHGFFYTISAFNNAGFALHPDSLMPYVDDPVVNLTITGLFITGGLGFTVWMDLWRQRRWQRLSLYSRIMIGGTVFINLFALLAIYGIELDNSATLAPLSESGKWLAAWFQAVTPRTAGFNTLPIDQLEDATTVLMLLLMFIGGGSLSTASGIKVVTFVVLLVATVQFLKRQDAINLCQRQIQPRTVQKALALTLISCAAVWLSIFLLTLTEDAPFLDVVFEAVSALGTVGLSRGLTEALSPEGECIIIFMMFAGRLGPLTLAYLLASPKTTHLRYPATPLTIG
ncbi:TrkH family potassium uptake protein [Photobacterium sp. CCB-ST2H9]|uniref:TrkH family potassium uptake protein n=1 Tax=Photobacterium sp. CCB-ST2H9 TaxID=2912855 RepID=UPI0020040146|nr:TrkH family potassium uptake protein [Photobacterium sp. CCB-ST2H9]UTM59694.1 TrkH family potassium uptake protein [Photobacterium sp. CCB-ST2H9]